jgi:hypothetical protein
MKNIPAAVLAVSLAVTLCAAKGSAQKAGCSRADAEQAETAVDTLKSWDALYKSYGRYRDCDDGAIAEGYSDSVAKILAKHWSTLPRLSALSRGDAGFRKFVLGHIDASADEGDLERAAVNARKKCPAALGWLCSEVAKRADEALKEARDASRY